MDAREVRMRCIEAAVRMRSEMYIDEVLTEAEALLAFVMAAPDEPAAAPRRDTRKAVRAIVSGEAARKANRKKLGT
jgi:hypothetical protein